MKPFDLEAAKRGEPICYGYEAAPQKAHYIGQSLKGLPVIQKMDYGSIFSCDLSLLFMAPKKVTVRYRIGLYRDDDGLHPFLVTSDFGEKTFIKNPTYAGWLTDWQEVEVPQGGE